MINEAKLRKIFVAVPLIGNTTDLHGLPQCDCKEKVEVPTLYIRHGVQSFSSRTEKEPRYRDLKYDLLSVQ